MLLVLGVAAGEADGAMRVGRLLLVLRWGHREVARVLLTEGGADYTLATRESDGFGDASSKTCKDVAWEHGYEELVAVIEVGR